MQTPTILILDKEEAVRDSLSLILHDEGYRCVSSANAADVLDIIKQGEAAIIIVDCKIAGQDDIKYLIEEPLPTLRIILMSSYVEIENCRFSMLGKADKFILKPLDFDELLLSINELSSGFPKADC